MLSEPCNQVTLCTQLSAGTLDPVQRVKALSKVSSLTSTVKSDTGKPLSRNLPNDYSVHLSCKCTLWKS